MSQSPILEAFGAMRAATRSLYQLPEGATDGDAEVFHVVIDEGLVVMQRTTAQTPAEHAAKLRAGMQNINRDRDDTLIIYGLLELLPDGEGADGRLTASDTYDDLIWSTILDLEKQGAAQ